MPWSNSMSNNAFQHAEIQTNCSKTKPNVLLQLQMIAYPRTCFPTHELLGS